MNLFKGFLSGQESHESAVNPEETIRKLVTRVETSTLLTDRRDAVRALKSLSTKYKREIAFGGLNPLMEVIQKDRSDVEIITYAVETLCNILTSEISRDNDEAYEDLDDLGVQFADLFLEKTDNVISMISLLEEFDFHIRWPVVRLLTNLLLHRGKEMQECILIVPMGVSRLMDLLSDSREVIRNDALILLNYLCRFNHNIQKIIVFENAFPKIFQIIEDEGFCDGGLVVEDSLILLLHLLKGNSSNQNYFKEGSFIQCIKPFIDYILEQSSPVTEQKSNNIIAMLQVVRTLVSTNGTPQKQINACQKVMYSCGLLQSLCSILMAGGIQAEVLTEAICTVAEVIRGNQINQDYFALVVTPSDPPRPILVSLLNSMLNESQPFLLRCAILYCFQSYLYRNDLGRSKLIQTFLPQSEKEVDAESPGYLICAGLVIMKESLSSWFSAVVLMHSIHESAALKEQLLRVQLAGRDNSSISLLDKCCEIVSTHGSPVQTRVGILQLLAAWLYNCNISVMHFLNTPANVPLLISLINAGGEGTDDDLIISGLCSFVLGLCVLYNNEQVHAFNKGGLLQAIRNHIGLEVFSEYLSQISKFESYLKAAKKPQLSAKAPQQVVFDHEFTRLFKSCEADILRAINSSNQLPDENSMPNDNLEIVVKYKEIIRQLDEEKATFKQTISALQQQVDEKDEKIASLQEEVSTLRDENLVFKTSSVLQAFQNDTEEGEMKCSTCDQGVGVNFDEEDGTERVVYKQFLEKVKQKLSLETNDLSSILAKIDDLFQNRQPNEEVGEELATLKKEQEDLLVLLSDQDNKIEKYRARLKEIDKEFDSPSESEEDLDENDLM